MWAKSIATAAICLGSMLCASSAAAAQRETLAIYERFATEPQMSQVAVSPDGKSLAAIQRFSQNGENLLLIYDATNLSAKPVTLSADPMQIEGFFWANDERLVVSFRQQIDAKQRTSQYFRRASIDKAGKEWVPVPRRRLDRRSDKAKALENALPTIMLSAMPWDENHVLLLQDRDQDRVFDVVKVNVADGKPQLAYRGSRFLRLAGVDGKGAPRLAERFHSGRDALIYLARLEGSKEWLEIGQTIAEPEAMSELFGVLGFFNEEDPNEVWVISNHDADTTGVFAFDIATKAYKELLFRHPKYDAVGVSTKFVDGKEVPVAFLHNGRGVEQYYFDAEEEALMKAIDALLPRTDNRIVSRSKDDGAIVVRASGPQHPPAWYLLRDKSKMDELGKAFPDLDEDMLSPVEWVHYKARDGLEIPALVTAPKGEGPFPTVVLPHGGPVARDYWDFDPWSQLLANRGYAVIQPQFRISQGFGRKHFEAGFGQWGLAMQDDLDDAAQYLVKRGIADPQRLAIFGWSYGGYAAFVGSARDPNPYKCAISGAGVADLPFFRAQLADGISLIEKAYRPTVDGVNALDVIESVDVPLLVIHGTLDERVPIAESRKFVAGLKAHGKRHEFLELEGANHFFGTIHYRHWMQMYPAMINWLDDTCGLSKPEPASEDA